MISGLLARSTEPQTGWYYDQSTLQAFYMLEEVTVDGVIGNIDNYESFTDANGNGTWDDEVEQGCEDLAIADSAACTSAGGTWSVAECSDGVSADVADCEAANETWSEAECDVDITDPSVCSTAGGTWEVGSAAESFDDANGNNVWDSIVGDNLDIIGSFIMRGSDEICVGWVEADPEGYTTVPLMGNDGAALTSNYLTAGEVAYLKIYDSSRDRVLDLTPESDLPGWAISEISIIAGTSTANNALGCMNPTACNFDSSAEFDSGNCEFVEDCAGVCGCSAVEDCAGACNGSAVVDECGICNGGNASKDCAGLCGGSSTEDLCNVCDDDPSNDNATCSGCMNADANNTNSGCTGVCTYDCTYDNSCGDDIYLISSPS